MRLLFGLLCFLLIVSCAEKPKKEVALINYIDAPSGPYSSLPNVFSNTKHTLMSWVEKVDDSTTQLKYARLINDVWKEPQLILQGRDWFVPWADFPGIAENDGNLISHVLRKSSKESFSYDVSLNVLSKGDSQWAEADHSHRSRSLRMSNPNFADGRGGRRRRRRWRREDQAGSP